MGKKRRNAAHGVTPRWIIAKGPFRPKKELGVFRYRSIKRSQIRSGITRCRVEKDESEEKKRGRSIRDSVPNPA